jgi:hypothetical protein
LTDQDSNIRELYGVPITGNFDHISLNGTLVSGGNVSSYKISTDTKHVIYLADQDTDNVFELYASKLPGFGKIFLPMVMNNYCSKFAGPKEIEPNDLSSQANGCLISGFVYSGNPDEYGSGQDSDYYYVNMTAPGTITIDVTNFLTDGQVQLYYQTATMANRKANIANQADGHYRITYYGDPGLYYVRVVSPIDHAIGNGDYSLQVSYP